MVPAAMTAAPFTTGDVCGFQMVTPEGPLVAGSCVPAADPQRRQKLSSDSSAAEQAGHVRSGMGRHCNPLREHRSIAKAQCPQFWVA
jgi:hypothetical protein